jgi:hypothetical protein
VIELRLTAYLFFERLFEPFGCVAACVLCQCAYPVIEIPISGFDVRFEAADTMVLDGNDSP